MDAADTDDNGHVFALRDALLILNYLFLEGYEIPEPTECGEDLTDDDDLGCDEPGDCEDDQN